jgi:hypothetical protein
VNARAVIERFLAAVIAGDTAAALRFCSPEFGVHDGLAAAGWIRWEEGEYARRGGAFGIGPAPGLVIVPGLPGAFNFAVLSDDGAFVSEDSLFVGDDGMIRGNGRLFEVVSKLAFTRGRRPARGLAIRGHGIRLDLVRPADVVATGLTLRRSATFDSDFFHTCAMSLPGDDLKGRQQAFRFAGSGAAGHVRQVFDVWLRGLDDPFFVGDLYPGLDGKLVTLPSGMRRYWSLMAAPADRAAPVTVAHPEGGSVHAFPWPVAVAVLTDALDNDWQSLAGDGNG